MRVLVIDNYDSFTYNLVQYLGELGAEVEVVRNDKATVAELLERKPDRLVISPGPCTPAEAGISIEASRAFPEAGIPTLGVCLGHQAMVEAFGGKTIRGEPIHGKDAEVEHDGRELFAGLPNPMLAGRYHSLVADPGDPALTSSSAPPATATSSWPSAIARCLRRASSFTRSRCSHPRASACSRTSSTVDRRAVRGCVRRRG